MWANWEPFNKNYFIRDRDYWNNFWDNCPYTEKQIYLALRNMSYACKKGCYETRYISPDPCQFIKGGMIDRGLSDGIQVWYDMDYGNWEDPNNEGYDKNLRLFED
jgi:hypothetical protein